MEYLHACHVVHGDLKVCTERAHQRPRDSLVADFGLARLHSYPPLPRTIIQDHREPALACSRVSVERRGNSTVASDVWAFAMTVFEIYTDGQVPFAQINNARSLYKHLKDENRPIPVPSNPRSGEHVPESELIWSLMDRCWRFEPQSRPNFSWILSALGSLYPVFQTRDIEMLVKSPTAFEEMSWTDSIFSEWPGLMAVLSNLLTANIDSLKHNHAEPSSTISVLETQSHSVLRVLVSVVKMARHNTAWYILTSSKEVFAALSDSRLIPALNIALKCGLDSDITLLACQVICNLFAGNKIHRFEHPPAAYRALCSEIHDTECINTLMELLRSNPSSDRARAIFSTISILLKLPQDPQLSDDRKLAWSVAESELEKIHAENAGL
ncbi:kinase-like domain-containing protein [Mycena sp. CBHHK59/15]|nr:kinase-like domain-containing protein [Mycena sp. CBHHK59/15]